MRTPILAGLMEVYIECHADEGYFEDTLTPEIVEELKRNGPIPCEGGGIGLHCDGCRFCATFDASEPEPK